MLNYVQIGSNIGKDDFQRKIKNLTTEANIFLIEPNLNFLEELRNNYTELEKKHKIVITSCGISNREGEADFYLYPGECPSLIKRRTLDMNADTVKIPLYTFNSFCKQHCINYIDYLSVDTEGLDCEILLSINLQNVTIKEIIFEDWPYEQDDSNNNYSTGPSILQKVREKYSNYRWSQVYIDSMLSYNLILEKTN